MPTSPGNDSCPCSAHVAPAYHDISIITDALIDLAIPDSMAKSQFLPLLLSEILSEISFSTICGNPRIPRPRDFTPFDWINPAIGAALAYDWLRYKMYEFVCECDDCPPISACGSGTCIVVGPDDGYLPDPGEPGVREYIIPSGSLIYAARTWDGYCIGSHSGIDIVWHVGGVFDPTNAVTVHNGDGSGAFAWPTNTGATPGVQLCFGGAQAPAVIPWPPAVDVEPFPDPPACTNSDICATLADTAKLIQEIRFLVSVIAGPLYGVTAPINATLPGVGNIEGALVDALPRLIEAIAPPLPSQLINPSSAVITTTSTISVTDVAYVAIVPSAIPDYLGYRGNGGDEIYYSNHRNEGPGWVVAHGQDSVLWHREILYPTGVEFQIPSMATDLSIHLAPGVAITVTTFERQV